MNRSTKLALHAMIFMASIITLLLLESPSRAQLPGGGVQAIATAITWSNGRSDPNGVHREAGKVSIAKDDKFKSITATATDAQGKAYPSVGIGYDGNMPPAPNSEITFYADFKDLPAGKYSFEAVLTYTSGGVEKKTDPAVLVNIEIK